MRCMELPNENKDDSQPRNEYAYEIGIRAIDGHARENGGILRFIQLCGQNIASQEHPQMERLSTLSSYIADVYGDPTDGDDQRAIKSALLKGIVTGICVADEAYGEIADVRGVVEFIEADRSQFATISDFYANKGRYIIETAREANQLMFAYEQTLSDWESECVTDIRYHQYYRMGFGFLMGNANLLSSKFWHENDLTVMGQQLDSIEQYDWDQALRLLGGGNADESPA